MTIEITKEVAIDLLKGVKPYYTVMHEIPSDLGYFCASKDEWYWNFDKNVSYTTEELYNLYLLCKESWKN